MDFCPFQRRTSIDECNRKGKQLGKMSAGRRDAPNFPSSGTSINAAALQSEMAKRFGLKAAAGRGGLGRRNSKASSPAQQRCLSCDSLIGDGQDFCVQCGYGVPARPADNGSSSLAQRRGLIPAVPVPPKPGLDVMKPLDWYLMEKAISTKPDPDICCPICMEKFSRSEEVLLSCGHIFHKVCLRSFENFVKGELSCPICRTKNYQKKLTVLGYAALERKSAAKIQALCRGFLARQQFKLKLRRLYRSGRGSESLRAKYFQTELSSVASRMDKSISDRASKVDTMMR